MSDLVAVVELTAGLQRIPGNQGQVKPLWCMSGLSSHGKEPVHRTCSEEATPASSAGLLLPAAMRQEVRAAPPVWYTYAEAPSLHGQGRRVLGWDSVPAARACSAAAACTA